MVEVHDADQDKQKNFTFSAGLKSCLH